MSETGLAEFLSPACTKASPTFFPDRLSFYENWLHSKGLRDGTIGLAPLYAVLSFLREEKGEDEDHQRSAVTSIERSPHAPASMRPTGPSTRWVGSSARCSKPHLSGCAAVSLMRVGRRVVRSSYGGSHVRSRLRRRTADIAVRASIFLPCANRSLTRCAASTPPRLPGS